MKKELKEAANEFEVRDMLAGNVTGDYAKDLKRAEKRGNTFSKSLYYEAYQNQEQP